MRTTKTEIQSREQATEMAQRVYFMLLRGTGIHKRSTRITLITEDMKDRVRHSLIVEVKRRE